uniref:Uncharacterized protein n=1 Tax=Anopheles quadriannulatus TaxID=34691 RepID=A0A182XSI8_ANOQN
MSSSSSWLASPECSLRKRFTSSTQVASSELSKLPTSSHFRLLCSRCSNVWASPSGTRVRGEIFAPAVKMNGLKTDSLTCGVAVNQWQASSPSPLKTDTWLGPVGGSVPTARRHSNICFNPNAPSTPGSLAGQERTASVAGLPPNASLKLNSPAPSHAPAACAFDARSSVLRSKLAPMVKPVAASATLLSWICFAAQNWPATFSNQTAAGSHTTKAAFSALRSSGACCSTSATSLSTASDALSPRSSPNRTRSNADTLPSPPAPCPLYDSPIVTAFSLDPLSAPQLPAGLFRMTPKLAAPAISQPLGNVIGSLPSAVGR